MLELPATNPLSLQVFFAEHRGKVHSYTIREILKGLKENSEKVELFRFSSGTIASVKRHEFLAVLNQALSYFIAEEQFEEAALCRDIITKVKCDDIVRTS